MDRPENEGIRDEQLSRGDFVKTIGLGMGAASIASMMGGVGVAAGQGKGKYVIVISHGGNDPNRAIFGLLMADVAASKGWGSVHVWLYVDGADLAVPRKAERIKSPVYENFGTAADLIKKLRGQNVWFGACPPCLDYFNDGNKYDFVEKAGGDWLMKNIQDSWVVWV
jgi:predicted peroxiredoxin